MALTQEQHLLTKLAEESNEIAKIALKAVQFGLLEHHPQLAETNKERLHGELNDLLGIVQMLNERLNFGFEPSQKAIQKKMNKVDYYAEYSRKLGLVE